MGKGRERKCQFCAMEVTPNMLIVQTKVLQGHALVVTAILNHQCHNQPHP